MPELTERRKADREEMARQIRALCAELGAEIDETTLPRGVALGIKAPGGLCVHVRLEGDSCQPDVHVIPWFTRGRAVRLVPAFGQVNPHHFGKATHVAYGSTALLAELRRGLTMARDGSAYQPAAEPTPGTPAAPSGMRTLTAEGFALLP